MTRTHNVLVEDDLSEAAEIIDEVTDPLRVTEDKEERKDSDELFNQLASSLQKLLKDRTKLINFTVQEDLLSRTIEIRIRASS